MSPVLMALVGAMLLPLFLASWRTSLFGLCCQGLLMGWLAVQRWPEAPDAGDWLTLVDLVVLRGLLGPALLYRVLQARGTPARNDVIAPNLLSWTFALALVLVAFNFSSAMLPQASPEWAALAVATAGLLLGFLVLSSQAAPFSQMVGALRIENAIALFELSIAHPHESVEVHAAQLGVYALTVGLFRWYLVILGPGGAPAVPPAVAEEGPTL